MQVLFRVELRLRSHGFNEERFVLVKRGNFTTRRSHGFRAGDEIPAFWCAIRCNPITEPSNNQLHSDPSSKKTIVPLE
jgi:hypothetical protein